MGDLVAVDLFAGGGGASHGIRSAIGRSPVLAVNHDEHAIRMHTLNHPDSRHLQEDVFTVDPRSVRGPVDLLWASPDCTHFSRAKGGKPVENKRRGLAWVVVEWARTKAPRMLFIENVPEFRGWGPLNADGTPNKALAGQTFREWVAQLRLCGYRVEHEVLSACDYGAPTTRKRLFVVARCDGEPIVWPEPTHGPGRARPWRTAAEIIDWSIPCPSIFERSKPLAEATLRRIAAGIVRYVLRGKPFIVRIGHQSSDYGKVMSVDAPLSTITSKNEHVLVGGKLVAAFLAKHYTGVVGSGLDKPIGSVTAIDHHSVVAAHLTKFYGTSTGSPMDAPAPVVTGQGQHVGLVAALLTKYYGEGGQDQSVGDPLHTILTVARFGLVTVNLDGADYVLSDIGLRMLGPRELARAQGFPDDYILTGTKSEQIARIGNSVVPQVAEAIVRANIGERSLRRAA